ncbi:MAG: outer membrane protein transport protein [Gammaproteobacteria bacterium]
MRKSIINNSSLVLGLCLAVYSTQSHSSGFALIENSASGQGNAFAGAAAAAEDASTIWFNPAGMMKIKDDQILIAGHYIAPKSSFTNGNSVDASGTPLTGPDDDGGIDAFVANFYWMMGLADNMKVGLGITTPFGLTTIYDDTWKGRYHAVESDLRTINFNPSIAYQVNDKLSLGGGVNLMLADVTLTSAVDFGALCYAALNPATCTALGNTPQGSDGFGDLTADNFSDLGWGLNLGLMYDFTPSTRMGVAWRSETKIKVDGDAKFKVPATASFAPSLGIFIDSGIKAEVTLPQSFSVSLAHERDKWTWLADITWTGWSSFQELRIKYDNPNQPDTVTTEDWNDTFRYSVGADYTLNTKWTLRGGLAYDETPIPNAERRTPRIPDNSRTWLSLGAGYTINSSFIVDVGYSHLFISDTPINNTLENTSCCLPATLNGTYTSSVDILSAQLRWNY